jgi:hypothetical protein
VVNEDSILAFRRSFPGKLGFWSVHCAINAVPSYLIAVVWLGLWNSLTAQLAMLAAVVTFILGYSVVTSWVSVLREGRNLFTRALHVGLVIRTIISCLTALAIPLGPFLLFTPDLWCGLWANSLVSKVFGFAGLAARTDIDGRTGSVADSVLSGVGFLEIYATTLVEGLILSFMLFIFSFLAILILQMRDRRKITDSW